MFPFCQIHFDLYGIRAARRLGIGHKDLFAVKPDLDVVSAADPEKRIGIILIDFHFGKRIERGFAFQFLIKIIDGDLAVQHQTRCRLP